MHEEVELLDDDYFESDPTIEVKKEKPSEIHHNVFVGSELGILKGVNLNQDSTITKNYIPASVGKNNTKKIVSLYWNDEFNKDEIFIGFENQELSMFDNETKSFTWSRELDVGEGNVVSAFPKAGKTVVALDSGLLGIVHGKSHTSVNTIIKTHVDRHTKKPTLCQAVPNASHPSQIATGGCENEVAVWDLNNPSVSVFRAKNVPFDKLQLRVPVWVSDLTYLPKSDLIAACSRHKHVRLYDIKARRKPVISFEFEDNPLVSIASVPSADREIVVGSNHGRIACFDLRKLKPQCPLFAFNNSRGAVKKIVVHDTLPLVFTASLDRFLRVYNKNTKHIIYEEYMKSRLTTLLVQKDLKEDDFCWGRVASKTKVKSKDEYDPLLDNVKEEEEDQIQTKRKKKVNNLKVHKTLVKTFYNENPYGSDSDDEINIRERRKQQKKNKLKREEDKSKLNKKMGKRMRLWAVDPDNIPEDKQILTKIKAAPDKDKDDNLYLKSLF